MALAEQVTSYTATVPVLSLNIFGDLSKLVLKVAESLSEDGYNANVRALGPRGVGVNTLLINLSKRGKNPGTYAPFYKSVANASVKAAAAAQSINIATITDDMLQVVAFVEEAPGTSIKAVGDAAAQAKAKYDACVKKGGWFCSLEAAGIPSWVPIAAGVVGIAIVLNNLANAKKAFIGGVDEGDDSYKWFVVSKSTGDVVAGNEYREDAIDAAKDQPGGARDFKVVHRSRLAKNLTRDFQARNA